MPLAVRASSVSILLLKSPARTICLNNKFTSSTISVGRVMSIFRLGFETHQISLLLELFLISIKMYSILLELSDLHITLAEM